MPALEAMQCILPALLCTAVHCSCNELSMYFSDHVHVSAHAPRQVNLGQSGRSSGCFKVSRF